MTNNTMTNPSNIERIVMRRVHTISVLRRVFSGTTLSGFAGAAALWGIGREVWVARVFENMPQGGDLLATLRFFSAAFENTEAVVQILTLLTLFSVVYLARETGRLISFSLIPAQAR